MSLNIRVESIATIQDVKEALQKIKERIESSVLDKGQFKFFEIAIKGSVSNLKYPHQFNFVPKDIIQLSVVGVGAVTWNYASFDATNLDISATGACVVRAYVGRYEEGGV